VTARWERLRRALRGDGRLPIGEALHPVALLAMVVLVVNDWVLKPRCGPSGDTGKLSDLAGLAAAPVVLTALIGLVLLAARRLGARVDPKLSHRRLVLAIAATGVVFAAIKLDERAARMFVELIGLVRPASVALDRTDLLCLPMLAVAYWIGRDELERARDPDPR
jgi:branched-subunit amino acid permease